MSHTQVTVTYSSTFASIHLSRASLVSLITCVRLRLSLKGEIWTSHVTHVSRRSFKGHIWMSHVIHIRMSRIATHVCEVQIIRKRPQTIKLFHTYEQSEKVTYRWVLSHIHEWIMSLRTSAKCRLPLKDRIRKSHLAHTNELCSSLHAPANSRFSFMRVRVRRRRQCVNVFICACVYVHYFMIVYTYDVWAQYM